MARVPREVALSAAARFAALPLTHGHFAGEVHEPDQWTLNKLVRPLSPFYKFVFDDASATEVYVSARTGEVLQFTRREDRFWGYLGAVVHWWYSRR